MGLHFGQVVWWVHSTVSRDDKSVQHQTSAINTDGQEAVEWNIDSSTLTSNLLLTTESEPKPKITAK